MAWVEQDGIQDIVQTHRIAPDGSSPDPGPLEVLRRSDNLLTCSVASRSDGTSLISVTTRRPGPAYLWGTSGHGVLYENPAATDAGGFASPVGVRVLGNPFRTTTTVFFGEREGRPGALRILDVRGRVVRVFEAADGLASRVRWDGTDGRGKPVAPGVYLYEITAAGTSPVTGKITKLR